ncbi:hypothetical protein [Candidatus Finniella inopinata]|uniref:Uncharacterized protein n=1 Tax=Candidatus Finniella inopinata TaxID=1696036 RepID=A0A4Q7DFW4_9PROT|nr:hypothetical protein [Candidatus Finniella inopinata]RZI45190.1 hypothetical protein EQU50_07870 [Candidatus Finniella inopinata]
MKFKNLALFLAIGALSQLSVSVVNASEADVDSGSKSKTLPSLRTSGASRISDIKFIEALNKLESNMRTFD